MARVNPRIRAARPGEGTAIAALWRELWDAHENWGGYPGSHDPRVYEQLATRLEQDAVVRAGHPVLGRHVHIVSAPEESVVGQVEGWFERHGVDIATAYTMEVRSLIVKAASRATGSGRALLDTLANIALDLSRGAPVVLAAEVLEPNPAQTFYARLGYRPVAWTTRIDTSAPATRTAYAARPAVAGDALAVALLETKLAARRRAAGDLRFDRPRGIDATYVDAIATHLRRPLDRMDDVAELVAVDTAGNVRASATFAVSTLEPPFLPVRRATIGRFALDTAIAPPTQAVAALVSLACRLAAARGAPTLELTDLTAPQTPLYDGAVAAGARPWSRVVSRLISGR